MIFNRTTFLFPGEIRQILKSIDKDSSSRYKNIF